MCQIQGFDDQIIESLKSKHPDIHYQAVRAAGRWELDAAWDHVVGLVHNKAIDKPLLLAAIEAVAAIRPQEALLELDDYLGSNDEEISDTVHEALLTSGAMLDLEADEYEDDVFVDGEEED